MQALVFEQTGTIDNLQVIEQPAPVISETDLLVSVSAAGLNFADIYRRQGRYPLAGKAPYIAGYEGAGIVTRVGAGVHGWQCGDRVGFADVPYAHASQICIPAEHAIRLPDWLELKSAAGILLQGLTADYLCHDLTPVRAGMSAVVLAGAGGTGRLLTGMLRALGVSVFSVASTPLKQSVCRQAGANAVSGYEHWVSNLKAWAPEGCDLVFDSVGTTIPQSLSVLRPCGRLILYGMSGGGIPAIDPALLMPSSLSLIGCDLWSFLTSQQERQQRADRLFENLRRGLIELPLLTEFRLSQGRMAHQLLENRNFSGKIILIPDVASC